MSSVTELWSAGSYAVAPADLFSSLGLQRRRGDGGAAWATGDRAVPVRIAGRLNDALGGGDTASTLEALSDPTGRRTLQVRSGISGEVLHPDREAAAALCALGGAATVEAAARYNEWIAGFVAADPTRFVGVGLIPPTGLDDALDALRQCRSLGLRAVSLLEPPAGPGTAPGGDAEDFWELAGGDLIVAIGAEFSAASRSYAPQPPRVHAGKPPSVGPFLTRLVYAGVADLVPDLRVLLVNVGAGSLPYVLESADTNYQRASASRRVALSDPSALPSEYVRRFIWTTFHEDRFAVLHRSFFGTAHLLWSSEAPTHASDWPSELEQAARVSAGLPDDDRRALLGGTCRRLFAVADAARLTDDEVQSFERTTLFR